jgi:FK506-binding nuclear protein
MKVGGVRRLIIPAQYAYGAQAQGGIPANSDLVFDITLLAVK